MPNRDDPATTSLGYENTQAIADFTVALHRDHIIPYDLIISFVNIILEHNELKINSWIEQALNKYFFNQNREKQEIYSYAINDNDIRTIIIPNYNQYKDIFNSAGITDYDTDETKINAIIKYLYELNDLTLQDDVNNHLNDVRKALHDKKIIPSSFFTDDESGLYIDVNALITRYKNNPFTEKDKVVIKRATGWMPGNIFLAPYPKPQDKGNVFDCTVAAASIPKEFINTLCSAYKAIIEFEKDQTKTTTAKDALTYLSIIANSRENFWPFIYGNWKYYSNYDKTFFYPYQIFDIENEIIEYNEEIPICEVLDEQFLRDNNNLSGQ